MTRRGQDADCLVVGAGMAGLAAALTAAERGVRVLLLEKGDRPGGSAWLSGGLLWTDPSVAELRARIPAGDPELGAVLVNGHAAAAGWLREHGVELSDHLTGMFGTGHGYRIGPDMPTVLGGLVRQAEHAGACLRYSTPALGLLTDAGAVVGVRTESGDVPAPTVVLATGGFGSDRELVARHITRYADRLVVRANPHNTGDGLTMGLSAGAATHGAMDAFYGHTMPMLPTPIDPGSFITLSHYFSPHGVLLNVRGERFVDESEADEVSTQALARQPGAMGFLVVDARGARRAADPPSSALPSVDRIAAIRAAGGVVLRAASLPDLAELIATAGGDRRGAEEVEAFNRAMTGRGPSPAVPRAAHRVPLTEPPFHAFPVITGITFTEGGLHADARMRVLSTAGEPIPGLYAAGVDVGGVFSVRYAGGLALATVFGRIAGNEIASRTIERRVADGTW